MALVLNKWENLVYYKVNPNLVNVGSLSEKCVGLFIEESAKEQRHVRDAIGADSVSRQKAGENVRIAF